MRRLLLTFLTAVSVLALASGAPSSASSAPSMILYSRLRSSLVCLTAPEVEAMQTQLSLRMDRIMDQYLALWRMEGRSDDDVTALYEAKHGELLSRTNERRDEVAAKQCSKDAASHRSSLRPAAPKSASAQSGDDDGGDDADDSPRYDASIHPYTPPYAPTVPAIFTGLTEQDIRDRHRQAPPPPQTDPTAVESHDDDDDDDVHDGEAGEIIGSITPMSLESNDGETDDRHFVASIAPQRSYHEEEDDNSSFASDRRNPRSSRARIQAIQNAARSSDK